MAGTQSDMAHITMQFDKWGRIELQTKSTGKSMKVKTKQASEFINILQTKAKWSHAGFKIKNKLSWGCCVLLKQILSFIALTQHLGAWPSGAL